MSSYEDLLLRIRELYYQKDSSHNEYRMYTEDEIVEALCNEQIAKLWVAAVNNDHYMPYVETTYCVWEKDDVIYYTINDDANEEYQQIRDKAVLEKIQERHIIEIMNRICDCEVRIIEINCEFFLSIMMI